MTGALAPRLPNVLGASVGAVLALVLGLVLVKYPEYPFALVAAVTLFVVVLRRLAIGVAVLAATALLQQAPGLGSHELTVVKLIGAILAAAWLVQLRAAERETTALRKSHAWTYLAVGLAAWSLCSAAWALNAGVALSNGFRLAQGLLLLVVTYAAVRQRRDAILVLGALVVGGLATTAIGFATGASVTYNQWGALVPKRFGGFTGDPNELGAQLIPAVVLCLILAVAPGRRLIRVAATGATLVLLAGLAATASRGAALGLAGALIATPVLVRGIRLRGAIAAAAGVGVAALLIALVNPVSIAQRLSSFSGGGTGRSDLWRVALRMAEDHPLQGVGAGNFPTVAPRYVQSVPVARPDLVYTDPHVVHNTYLQFFAETGLVGVAAFALLVLIPLSRAREATRSREGPAVRLSQAVLVATLGYLIAVFFISAAYEKPLWVLLAVCLRLPEFNAPATMARSTA
jgi:O-antigen ligase